MGLLKWFIIGVAAAIFYLFISSQSMNKGPLFVNLRREQQDWFNKGRLIEINGYRMFYRYKKSNEKVPVVILVHGFPSSSFDYHKAFDILVERHQSVLAFDHVGFGFSDKPSKDFSYSIIEHADQMLSLWRALNISEAHLVAHDMGDSIVTEILNRRRLNLLSNRFEKAVKSVTFTNGGMMVEHIGFRLSQRLLLTPYLGQFLTHLNAKLGLEIFTRQQLASIWGNSKTGRATMNQDISDLMKLNAYGEGSLLMHKMIHYLRDRFIFEPRWLRSVKELDVPCRFLWGDSDAVAPAVMATSLHKMAPHCELKFLETVGHFLMLESPIEWADAAVVV